MKRAIILASISVLCFLQVGWGQVPLTMSYQGVLKDASGVLVDNTLTITFSLYDVETDGTALWSEPQSVVVTQGVFSVILGETTALPDPFPAPAWLGIDVGATGEELSPRTRLTSSPYSFNALRADTAQYALSAPTSGGAGWSLSGNAGTTDGTEFLGTTDNKPLNLHVNGARALRLEPNATSPNVIGGYSGNTVTSGIWAATIGGGGSSGAINQVTRLLGTIGGGRNNTASGDAATVSGGANNTASGEYATVGGGNNNTASFQSTTIGGGWDNTASYKSTIGGGVSNTASNYYATVGGGSINTASGGYATVSGGSDNAASNQYATVGGGGSNTASGWFATVPGGHLNTAADFYSFAAGYRAKANHRGSFVWADSTDANFASTGEDQFLIRASGGVGIGTNSPTTALEVSGTVKATAFSGDGSGLTNLPGGGDITAVNAGTGLTGGGTTGDVTLSVDFTGSTGSAITAARSDHGHAGEDITSGTLNNARFSAYSDLSAEGYLDNNASADLLTRTQADGRFWSKGGNTVGSIGIIGTSNNYALDFRVNNARALRLEPHANSPNVIGGYSGNSVTGGIYGATIGGGGSINFINQVTANFGTVGGGRDNTASGDYYATVGGGENNTASGSSATVGGGENNTTSGYIATVGGGNGNTASGPYTTVSGGNNNTASGQVATVGGGVSNTASGYYATVPGGYLNVAGGSYSFAAGRRAKIGDTHDGTFVWADGTDADFASTAANQFLVRASGGTKIYSNTALTAGVSLAAGGQSWSSASDRNLKANFRDEDGEEVLAAIAAMPVPSWNYKSQDSSIRHLGPMAQDFYAAFGLGEDERHINTVDIDGINLLAIQALDKRTRELKEALQNLDEKTQQIDEQAWEIAELRVAVASLEAWLKVAVQD